MAASRLKASLIVSSMIAIKAMAIWPSAACAWVEQTIDPTRYVSPSGEYVLTVHSSDEYRYGPGSYLLMHRGHKVWRRRLPFTLIGASVSDGGIVGGYSYLDPSSNGFLEIVILDKFGKFRMDDRIPLVPYVIVDGKPDPSGDGVFIDQARNKFVVRETIWKAKEDTEANIWRQYRLSTGARLPDFDSASLKLTSKSSSIADAQPVHGTPLTLFHCIDGDDARFVLLDPQFKVVWQREFRNDYDDSGKGERQKSRIDIACTNGAILPATQPGSFAIWSVARGVKITYAVKSTGQEQWKVVQTGTTRYSGRQ